MSRQQLNLSGCQAVDNDLAVAANTFMLLLHSVISSTACHVTHESTYDIQMRLYLCAGGINLILWE